MVATPANPEASTPVEILTVGPGGDIPFENAVLEGAEHVVGQSEGAPAFENGWEELEGQFAFTSYTGKPEPNEEDPQGRHKTSLQVSAKRQGGPSADTIFTLPVGFRPLVKQEFLNLVVEVDGQVHPAEAVEQIDVGTVQGAALPFDSEFNEETVVAELVPGVEVTVTKTADGIVQIHGFAKCLEELVFAAIQLPVGFRPAQPVVIIEPEIEVDTDGFVWLGAISVLVRELEDEGPWFSFDSLTPFQAAAP